MTTINKPSEWQVLSVTSEENDNPQDSQIQAAGTEIDKFSGGQYDGGY